MSAAYPEDLLRDVHEGLSIPEGCDRIVSCEGYSYYHYGCDGTNDSGWGCGYRTLQTMCSWIVGAQASHTDAETFVPTIPQIQEVLVSIGDKEEGFNGSKEWIGSVEVGLVIDKLYDVPCKILHISSGSKLCDHITEIEKHLRLKRSPIMMGGESDNSSKGVIGLATSSTGESHLLILDPHYMCSSEPQERTTPSLLQTDKWISWRSIKSFHQDTFYNLCLPQT